VRAGPLRDNQLGINMHTLKALFLAALDKHPPQRAAFLDEACGSDLALRREVETLCSSCTGRPTASSMCRPSSSWRAADRGALLTPWRQQRRARSKARVREK
jgi:hypothetical protein